MRGSRGIARTLMSFSFWELMALGYGIWLVASQAISEISQTLGPAFMADRSDVWLFEIGCTPFMLSSAWQLGSTRPSIQVAFAGDFALFLERTFAVVSRRYSLCGHSWSTTCNRRDLHLCISTTATPRKTNFCFFPLHRQNGLSLRLCCIIPVCSAGRR